ncbi:MAG: BNR repeat-containing protein, partial [Candidatus Hydrogenedentes bacterium]|nr:BNR repeat-containing protein [Candidatus Hydrogenedentota bacterium]
ADDTAWTSDFRIGGCGGVYFLVESGKFWVEVEKQDLNKRGRKTHVRAILFAPDRSVVAEQALPHMGMEKGSGAGPVQRVRFSVDVPRKGVYGLNITASEDRYGQDMVWGMKTNCPRYLVETSRGHKDARHQEPLVLQNGDAPGTVCFLPRQGVFDLDVSGFRGETLRLLDATGHELAKIPVKDDGTATYSVSAATRRENVPWQFEMSGANGTVNIDGVTRWNKEDGRYTNLSLWTPKVTSWFPFHENRWLITPYKQRIDVVPGSRGEVTFEIHNNGPVAKTVGLRVEFSGATPWPATLSENTVRLESGQAQSVILRYEIPDSGDTWTCHVRATPQDGSDFSTYATVDLRRDTGQVSAPLAMPIVLKPYTHENAQFGYNPDYPLTNQVYFDQVNSPVIPARDSKISILRDGQWEAMPVVQGDDGTSLPFSMLTSKVAFDRDNDRYVLGKQNGKLMLLHATATGDWKGYPVPGKGVFDIEQFSGHNTPEGPPPFVRITRTAKDPKLHWRSLNDLALFLPEKGEDGTIRIGEPVVLTRKCIGHSTHSGIPSTIVSQGAKVHLVWAEATEPEEKVPGVPTYVATYDRNTGAVSAPALVGYGPPANDVHNTPCITMDSQGYLHVLVGTHGRTFKYSRSLKPNDASGGWTPAEEIAPGLRQTYVGLVCGPDDTLHLVFRLWRTDRDYFPASHYATLAYMKKPANGGWSEPRPLVVAPFSEYSVFYHRLTIDRKGALFLSYDYWSTYWFYRTDRRETRRALITSSTGGDTWKLATLGGATR